jgi:hypothetical protein
LLLSQYQYDDQGRLQAHNVSQRDSVLFQRRYVPKPMTSGAKADGRFNNDAFPSSMTRQKTNTFARLERR